MPYYEIITFMILCLLLNVILNLKSLGKPNAASISHATPLISILIPARNEETNIGTCLKSLCRQDYPNFEILVVDDNSTDSTAAIVEAIAARDNRVQLIRGQPLPRGWTGKSFACYQLALKARGDWFLFTDADTVHEPHMLRVILSSAMQSGGTLLSGFPRQQTVSTAEQIAVPLLYFILLSWVPFWLLQRSHQPRPTLAIGQFMFFQADAYWAIGGHERVKSKIIEDLWFGIEITRHGMRQIALDLSTVVSTRMYRRIGDMWEGFLKWTYSVASVSSLALLFLEVSAFFLFLVPFLWLAKFLIYSSPWETLSLSLVISVTALLLMRWLVDRRFHHSILGTVLHPLAVSFMLAAGVSGIIRRATGAGVRWKGRDYSPKSGIT